MPIVALVFADGGHVGRLVGWARRVLRIVLQIVRKLLPYKVSRSFSAAGSWREH